MHMCIKKYIHTHVFTYVHTHICMRSHYAQCQINMDYDHASYMAHRSCYYKRASQPQRTSWLCPAMKRTPAFPLACW